MKDCFQAVSDSDHQISCFSVVFYGDQEIRAVFVSLGKL